MKLSADEQAAIAHVAKWNGDVFYPDGARMDPQRVAVYLDPGASIWTRWMKRLQDALFKPWFAPVMTDYSLASFQDMIDAPDEGENEFEDNFDPFTLQSDLVKHNMGPGRLQLRAVLQKTRQARFPRQRWADGFHLILET